MTKILVMDSKEEADRLQQGMGEEYVVIHAEDVVTASDILDNDHEIDMLILSTEQDNGRGRELMESVIVPTIVVSPVENTHDHICALTLGAKDYLVKPLDPGVLAKHIEIRLGKCEARYLQHDKLIIDTLSHRVSYDSKYIPLTPTEYSILLYLFRHSDSYHTAEEIYEAIFHTMFLRSTTMKMHLSHLRNKLLEAAPTEVFISTMYGKGYRFVKE